MKDEEMKTVEQEVEEVEETGESKSEDTASVTVVSKPKWSLKKKLLIGGGVVLGLVLGALALGTKTSATADEVMPESGDDNTGEEAAVTSDEESKNSEDETN